VGVVGEFDGKDMERHITLAAASDEALFNHYLREQQDFEDSFHHLRIYFESSGQTLFKYHEDNALIFFSRNRRGHFKVFKPLGAGGEESLPEFLRHLSRQSPRPVDLRFLTRARIAFLEGQGITLGRVQDFDFLLYDLLPEAGGGGGAAPDGFVPTRDSDDAHPASPLSLGGRRLKNVRQKVNQFIRHHEDEVTAEDLSFDNLKDGIHFFAKWKKRAQERGFSYINIEKNKHVLRYLADKVDNSNIWCTLYRMGGVVEGVQALYRINDTCAAHVVGTVTTDLAGFSEWSQVHIWKTVSQGGVRYVNDGYSWTPRLRDYKMKFCPTFVKTVYRGLYTGRT